MGTALTGVRADSENTSTGTPFVTARPLLGECAMSRTMATVRVKVERNSTQSTIMPRQNQRSTWAGVVAVLAIAGATGVLYVNLAFGVLAVTLGV